MRYDIWDIVFASQNRTFYFSSLFPSFLSQFIRLDLLSYLVFQVWEILLDVFKIEAPFVDSL